MTDDIDNNTIPLISDQLLEAYVDGQLDSETERRVENLIANDQTLRDKALHMMGLREGLRRAVTERAGMPAREETYRLAEAVSAKIAQHQRRRVPKHWMGIAAAFVLVALTGGIWLATAPQTGSQWVASLKGFATDAARTVNREQGTETVNDASDAKPLQALPATVNTAPKGAERDPVPEFVPAFNEWGFSLVERRLIGGKDQDAVPLLYESADGRRVSLYYNSVENGGKQQVTVRQEGPLALIFWYAGERAFSMIGEVDRNELLKLARTVTAGLSLDKEGNVGAPPSENRKGNGEQKGGDTKPKVRMDGNEVLTPSLDQPSNPSAEDAKAKKSDAI